MFHGICYHQLRSDVACRRKSSTCSILPDFPSARCSLPVKCAAVPKLILSESVPVSAAAEEASAELRSADIQNVMQFRHATSFGPSSTSGCCVARTGDEMTLAIAKSHSHAHMAHDP